jgi:hypothetical protein
MLSNSVIGQNLTRAHPTLANAIGIHPTEDPGDPGYTEHSNELLPLDLMVHDPKTTAGHTLHGALKAVAGMTTPSSVMTTMLTTPALKGVATALPAVARLAIPAISAGQAVPSIYRAINAKDSGDAAENAGESLPNLAMAAASTPELIKHVGDILPDLKGMIASEGTLNKKIPALGVSPRELYETARDNGVNLDASQATGGKAIVPKMVKKVTEHSLIGSNAYEENAANNIEALQRWAEDTHNAASPTAMSREDFGNAAQAALKAHQKGLMDKSGELFDKLTSDVGDTQPDASGVRETAQRIIDDNQAYYQNHPELLKGGAGQAWSIAKDLAGGTKAAKPNVSAVLDAAGKPYEMLSTAKAADTWSDLQKLRSDLMTAYRSPDIAGSRSEGWLKQLAAATDNAMTEGSAGLTPDQLQNFRDANDLFRQAKEYDDLTSPFYHLVRSPDGLTTANSLAGLKPERVRQFNQAMAYTGNDALNAQLQRQAVNRLISPAGGEYDLKGLATRLGRTPAEQLAGVLPDDQIKNLQDLARTSRVVYADSNPSGSGKVVQRVLEGSAALKGLGTAAAGLFHGSPEMVAAGLGAGVAEPSLTAGLSKMMNSSRVVESLMTPKPKIQAPGLVIPSMLAAPLGTVSEKADQPVVKVPTVTPAAGSSAVESDADVMKRLGLDAEPKAAPVVKAPAAKAAKPETDEELMKRLGLEKDEDQ